MSVLRKREFGDETSIGFNYVYLMSIKKRKSKENLTWKMCISGQEELGKAYNPLRAETSCE